MVFHEVYMRASALKSAIFDQHSECHRTDAHDGSSFGPHGLAFRGRL